MRSVIVRIAAFAAIMAGGGVPWASGAVVRVMPAVVDAAPGSESHLTVTIETESGDNTVGYGYFSFATDLTVTGPDSVSGSNIGGVEINTAYFDDALNNSLGGPEGNRYVDVAGVTTAISWPTFGENVGDIILLFGFDFTVPAEVAPGDAITITITPSEGFLRTLSANEQLDPVEPERFATATIRIVTDGGGGTGGGGGGTGGSGDSDADGVADLQDACSDTPTGAQVDVVGCAASQRDSDTDGVTDDTDACPDTAVGAQVDNTGCPLPQDGDADGDGVNDDADQCPNSPAGQTVDSNGCPVDDPGGTDPPDPGDTGRPPRVGLCGAGMVETLLAGALCLSLHPSRRRFQLILARRSTLREAREG